MKQATLQTQFGAITVFVANAAIVRLDWCQSDDAEITDPLLARAVAALRAYCDGARAWPADLPLAPHGTPFQQRVWQRLREIPLGATASYGALAAELVTGPRAVARACASNPLPLLIPCHRVIAGDGRLGGYSGGSGVATKAALLGHEAAAVAAPLPPGSRVAQVSPA